MAETDDKQLAKIKKSMKGELNSLSSTADVLAGKTSLKKLDKKTKANSTSEAVNLNKFGKFLEGRYNKKTLITVSLKKEL